MSQAHYIQPTGPSSDALTVRLGGTSTTFNYADLWKIVKQSAESQYDLAAAGDPIEAFVQKVEEGTSGGFTVGNILDRDRVWVIADGLQATPGTGNLLINDYVCTGTVVARNTALSSAAPYAKVTKSTVQIGAVAADLAAAVRQLDLVRAGSWRVVSLGPAGTGAVGTLICIAPVSKKL